MSKKSWSEEFNHVLNRSDKLNKAVCIEPNHQIIESLLKYLESEDFKEFYGKPFQSLLIEGGAKTLSLFIKSDNFDAIHRFVGQKSLSGNKHKVAFFTKHFIEKHLDLFVSHEIHGDSLFEYVRKSHYQDFFCKDF